MKIRDAEDSTIHGPTKLVVHGVHGIGKTTLLAHFPKIVILASEKKNIPRDLPFAVKVLDNFETWEMLMDLLESMLYDEHDYEAVGFDTVDWIEPLIHAYVLRRDSGRRTEINPKGHQLLSIEDYGFGKGYIAAEEEFRKMINLLDAIQHKRAMHVIMLAHSHVKEFKNPAGENFDRWEMKCHPRIAKILSEYGENVLFLYFEEFTKKLDRDDKKAKGESTGRRMIGTVRTAMYDAKNRLRLPPEMELGDPAALIPMLLGHHLGANVNIPRPAAPPARPAPVAPAQQNEDRSSSVSYGAGPQSAGPQSTDPSKTASRTWTAPTPQAQPNRQPTPVEAARAGAQQGQQQQQQQQQQQYSEPAPAPQQQQRSQGEQIDRVTRAIEQAGRHSAKERAKVEKWLKEAAGENSKIESVISYAMSLAAAA